MELFAPRPRVLEWRGAGFQILKPATVGWLSCSLNAEETQSGPSTSCGLSSYSEELPWGASDALLAGERG